MRALILTLLIALNLSTVKAEDGYELWLRYKKCDDAVLLNNYRTSIHNLFVLGETATINAAASELKKGFSGILDKSIPVNTVLQNGSLVIGNAEKITKRLNQKLQIPENPEGFSIQTIQYQGKKITVISSLSDIGVLYGSFHLLRMMQTNQPISNMKFSSSPALGLRMINHWDNLNRSVERGYAGIALWNWHTLPDYKDPRYTDYARANASIGINAVTVTNVNANSLLLTPQYLEKIGALANIFRPYGIRIFLTARFNAPMELDKFKTADPLNESVQQWWKKKTDEIFQYIPDCGGFLVKANSEGQPGPQNYKRTHADGANMLAKAVAEKGGKVIWRAFVYNPESTDRFKQSYEEFHPLDGSFDSNVLVQVKNGPIDFQPREPFSPLFGAMKKTPMMMEFQLTQEYLGQSTHLVYEAPMFREVLDADTYQNGKGTEVSKTITGMAGVSNIGNDRNWTGHLFGQANWYAYGRLCWDLKAGSEEIAKEWIMQTLTKDKNSMAIISNIMMQSHQTLVNYMTPLGLAHIMGNGHHYGPLPWGNSLGRPDWNPVYYHKADSLGIGFNRTTTGTNALSQFHPEVQKQWIDPNTCDERYLLWFHHVPWDKKMQSGKMFWNELVDHYYKGVEDIRGIQRHWLTLAGKIDEERFNHVSMMLNIQVKEAVWWRNACLLYFQTFSKMPFPDQYEKPDKTLEYYKSLRFPYAPGNG